MWNVYNTYLAVKCTIYLIIFISHSHLTSHSFGKLISNTCNIACTQFYRVHPYDHITRFIYLNRIFFPKTKASHFMNQRFTNWGLLWMTQMCDLFTFISVLKQKIKYVDKVVFLFLFIVQIWSEFLFRSVPYSCTLSCCCSVCITFTIAFNRHTTLTLCAVSNYKNTRTYKQIKPNEASEKFVRLITPKTHFFFIKSHTQTHTLTLDLDRKRFFLALNR